MLANRPIGVAEQPLVARGFIRRMLLGPVSQGLATLTYGSGRGGGKMQITAARRVALAAEK
jgi:hypothetical protein